MGIWLILVERLETLIWRVLIRKMYPPQAPFPPQVPLETSRRDRGPMLFGLICIASCILISPCERKIQMPMRRFRYTS
jgi:hypothetical protein